MIPFYLENYLKDVKIKSSITTGILRSSNGNTDFNMYYYGDLINIKKVPFIVDSDYPCLIVAEDKITKERIIIFDGMIHGYDAMFCNEYHGNIDRNLTKYEKYSGEIKITLGYSIDYEDEKDEYDFDGEDVILMYGKLNWKKAKSIGYDWISIKIGKKEIFEMELA